MASDQNINQVLQEIKNFISAHRPLQCRNDFPTATDLDELYQNPEMTGNTRVWRAENGALVTYAFVHFPYNNLSFEISREHWSSELEDDILAWAENRMRAHYPNKSDWVLDGSCRADDELKTTFFKRNGFEKQGVESMSFVIDLSSPLPAPVMPPGFSIRSLDPNTEIQAAVDLLQAAYGTDNFTLADRLALMNTESYIPELDLVALAPDGRLAGNCICGIEKSGADRSAWEGFTDPVVVHPNFQRMGLATALLLLGLERLRLTGAPRVRLGTSSSNTGMQRAAEATGFRCIARHAWYSKKLE